MEVCCRGIVVDLRFKGPKFMDMGRARNRAAYPWSGARADIVEAAERSERTEQMVRDADLLLQQRTEEIEQERQGEQRRFERERKAAYRRT